MIKEMVTIIAAISILGLSLPAAAQKPQRDTDKADQQKPDRGKANNQKNKNTSDRGKKDDDDDEYDDQDEEKYIYKRRKFEDEDYRFNEEDRYRYREFYRGYENCPPGLAKKNNGCLPPGQAKKRYEVGKRLPEDIQYDRVPEDLERRLPWLPEEYEYGILDGDLLLLEKNTSLILDAIGFNN